MIDGLKLNSTVVFGSNDSTADSSNLIVMTLKSQSTDLTKAEGTKVKNIPSNLPKVTNAADGKPSIDMNGYKGSDKLVVQPLIEGNGDKLESNSYAVVKYTGWLLDGKQFDSSWDRNSTFDVNMQGGVIEGWLEGLKGQKVGSEVLLVVPPSLGYGDQAAGRDPGELDARVRRRHSREVLIGNLAYRIDMEALRGSQAHGALPYSGRYRPSRTGAVRRHRCPSCRRNRAAGSRNRGPWQAPAPAG